MLLNIQSREYGKRVEQCLHRGSPESSGSSSRAHANEALYATLAGIGERKASFLINTMRRMRRIRSGLSIRRSA